jgi:signal transduction histidine kinase
MLGGVCGAASRRLGWDITIVRVIFVVAALSGFPIAVYVLGWLLIPLEGETTNIASRALGDLRGIVIVVAFIPLLVIALLVASALGAGWVGNFAWPLLISGAGLVLIWRNGTDADRAVLRRATQPFAELVRPGGPSLLSIRLALGILLLGGGLSALLVGHPTRAALRPLAGVLLVIAAIVVIFGPWWLRLGRDLVGERQARARAEERADMAARVHDSVLQTLALIQRRADRPQDVVQLARAQERELRAWLFEGRPLGSSNEADLTFAAGVARIQQEVEEAHGVPVDAVVVGDCPLDDVLRALLAAGKEATVNAAKWSGAPVVSVFAEVEADEVSMFVRDRGSGFDTEQVPADRKGLAESIRGRVARLDGEVKVKSTPGEGTEVALTVPLASTNGRRHPHSPDP